MTWLSNLARLAAQLTGEGQSADRLLAWSDAQERRAEILRISQAAKRRANYHAALFDVQDIGLMVYHSPDHARIMRSAPLMTDAGWLRPFVELKTGVSKPVNLLFEIYDGQGARRFEEKRQGKLRRKDKVIARTWLSMADQTISSRYWYLVIGIDGERIAVHRFEWQTISGGEILEQVVEDGEISAELRQALRTGKFRKMSLDELLSDQED